MSDETLIPLSPEEAPEATHEALPAETAEVVINDAPVTTEVVDDAPSVAEELDTTDAVQGDIADDAETSPIADTPAEEVAPPAKPQTIISAFGGNRSSGKSSSRRGGGHSSDSRPT